MRIILASQSPRRHELLSKMGVEFEVIPSVYDEKLDDSRGAEDVAKELALGKAMEVARQYPAALVIGADTIVTIHGKQLEKPTSKENAKELLTMLSGTVNYVASGLAVVCIDKNIQQQSADVTAVHFGPYDEAAIDAYIETGDPMDKAGAYSVQRLYGSLITKVEGDFDTITGLNTTSLAQFLNECGVQAKAVEVSTESVSKMV